jgi:ABC-type transport system involved in cytochrome c biogenesis permease subunit
MSISNIIRFLILGVLWLLLVGYILTHVKRVDFFTLFPIAASAVIIFVPMYKKYVKNGQNKR